MVATGGLFMEEDELFSRFIFSKDSLFRKLFEDYKNIVKCVSSPFLLHTGKSKIIVEIVSLGLSSIACTELLAFV